MENRYGNELFVALHRRCLYGFVMANSSILSMPLECTDSGSAVVFDSSENP